MKATFESLHPVTGNSFLVRRFTEKAFSAPYHYHPEFELTVILKGEGKRYVGNNLSPYAEGDVALLGSNLPHCWKSDNQKPGKINAISLVAQFTGDFLGPDFMTKSEIADIHRLLERSKYGIRFINRTAEEIKKDMVAMEQETMPFKRMIMLLEILQKLASSRQYILLDKQHQSFVHSSSEQKKINDVIAYIVENFKEKIILEEAAHTAGMTPTSFCKYFKRQTRKTFIETVLDYRINYAAQQLVNTDKAVSDIGFESGFGDVSHFYKTFRNKKKLSPLQYRRKFTRDLA
jgi:AraC-like DNA-binding protein/quercetin dioxygenase-like cupin family protein